MNLELHVPSQPSTLLSTEMEEALSQLMIESKYNWFEFYERTHEVSPEAELEAFFQKTKSLFNEECFEQICLSYEAFKADEMLNNYARDKKNRELNGEIVTDSESDNPIAYLKAASTKSEEAQQIIKRVATIQRHN